MIFNNLISANKQYAIMQSERDILADRLSKVQARCFELMFPNLSVDSPEIKSKMFELIDENEKLKKKNKELLVKISNLASTKPK